MSPKTKLSTAISIKTTSTLKNLHTRTNNADNSIQVSTNKSQQISDIYLQNIIDEFIIPFRKGEFYNINYEKRFNEYFNILSSSKNTNVCHNLAVESMVATLNAKNIHINFQVEKHKNSMCQEEKQKLKDEIKELNNKLNVISGNFSSENMPVTLEIEASVTSFSLIPTIAYQNIYLGWYFYFNKYTIGVGIDPDEYLRIKKIVDTYGSENIPGKNYSIAFVELMKLIGMS